MASLDLSRLSRPDALVALRSYPRRFRAAVLPADDPDVEELAYQVGPDGHSALDHVVAATNTFVLLGQAVHTALTAEEPVLHAAVTDRSEREWSTPSGLTAADALNRLEEEATALATRIEAVEGRTWSRPARVAGGGTITAFDVVKEAVAAGSEHLRAAGEAIAAARRRR